MYCVRAEAEGMTGGGSGVAVKARVGGGVSVGGRTVNVGTVAVAVGWMMGWNGVGVAEAFGFAVIRLTVGGGGAAGAIPQADRIKMKITMMAWMIFMRLDYFTSPFNENISHDVPHGRCFRTA